MTAPTFAELQATYERMTARRLLELRERFDKMTELRNRCDDELLVLADEIENFGTPVTKRRRSRFEKAECGTESGYQAHRQALKKAGEPARVQCDDCKRAHREHERIQSARRRLQKLAAAS